jgi:tetratricopeptide (TPR) repeat protein
MPKPAPAPLSRDEERELLAILDEAMELPPADRLALARARCGDRPALLRSAERMLAAADLLERDGSFLSAPPPLAAEARLLLTGDDNALSAAAPSHVVLALAGDYEFAEVIGRGGSATVFRARDLRHGRDVAIKIVGGAADQSQRARFLREIGIAAQLQHPYIVPLLNSGEVEGTLYYVMPLIEGESLRHRLDRVGALPLGEALGLVRDIAEALDVAHAAGVVHRDVKPQNVLLSGGHALVADFGVALARTPGTDARLTDSRLTVGTPLYMSPEQAAGAAVDGRGDVYALGCLTYELLTGEVPYGGATPQGVLSKHLHAPIPDPAILRPGLASAVGPVIVRALAKAPADRFATAGEFALALEAAVADLPAHRSPTLDSTEELRRLPPMPKAGSLQGDATRVTIVARIRRLRAARTVALVLVAIIAIASAVWTVITGSRSSAAASPVLAVGNLRDLAATDSTALSRVLAEMFATSLSRLTELRIIGTSRLLEVMPRADSGATAPPLEAARRAGASEVIEGEITSPSEGMLRLDFRRLDLASGTVRAGYMVQAAERYALIDSATVAIARDFQVRASLGPLAEVTTRSPTAYRLYEEGLRAFYGYDGTGASRLFDAALAEDSMFAMAAYYRWRASDAVPGTDREELADLALKLASRATERDQLIIRVHVGKDYLGPEVVVAAESLLVRYPNDPEALTRAADALARDRESAARAIRVLDRAIVLDSVAGTAGSTVCRLCEQLATLAQLHTLSDSSDAAERTLRRWAALRPNDAEPWRRLSMLLAAHHRTLDADRALDRATALGYVERDAGLGRLRRGLLGPEHAGLSPQCRDSLATTSGPQWLEYRTACVALFRQRGRYRDALLLAAARPTRESSLGRQAPPDVVSQAMLDMEVGRGRVAAATFLDLVQQESSSRRARRFPAAHAERLAWYLTLAAAAYVAADDTVRARGLIDSIAAVGAQAVGGDAGRLHHFARGLVLASAGRHDEALAQYRLSTGSWTLGFTRANYELARSALALGRPREAIYPLQAALRGGTDGPNAFLSRTAIHALLAEAFDRAGEADSAAAHYRVVVAWWRDADPVLAPQVGAAQRRLSR